MELNSFLFPAPQSSYTMLGAIGELIYVPRKTQLDVYKSDGDIQEQKETAKQVE